MSRTRWISFPNTGTVAERPQLSVRVVIAKRRFAEFMLDTSLNIGCDS